MKMKLPEGVNKNNFNEKAMEEYGFYCHMVPCDDDTTPTGANFHTHGLPDSFGHHDIQIVIALPENVFGSIIHDVVNQIKKGQKFEVGKKYSKVLANMEVTFIYALENETPILRMILPDKSGNCGRDMGEPYRLQYEGEKTIEELMEIRKEMN